VSIDKTKMNSTSANPLWRDPWVWVSAETPPRHRRNQGGEAVSDKQAEMWTALEQYQPTADTEGHGESWKRMTTERTEEAAEAALDAADAAADAARNVAMAQWAALELSALRRPARSSRVLLEHDRAAELAAARSMAMDEARNAARNVVWAAKAKRDAEHYAAQAIKYINQAMQETQS
jgi:hypothetical protein